jgi:hypothetical protein
VKQRWLLIAGAAAFLGCAPANAQVLAADVLPPYEVSTIVRSMGLTPLDRPYWRNGRYVLTATDRSGRQVRVVVDSYSGQVIRVRPMDVGYYDGPRGYGVRPDPYDPRYAAPPPPPRSIPNGPGYGPGPQPGYTPPQQPGYEDDDEYYDGRTGSISPAPSQSNAAPQSKITAPKVNTSPSSRSASIAPTKSPDTTPLPRPKPDVTQSASKKAEPPPVPQGEVRKIEITKPSPAPKAPETKASEVKTPEKAPETKAPETKAPEVKKDDSKTGTIDVPVTPML